MRRVTPAGGSRTGNAIINNCDTTVDVVADGGLVLGANVQSWDDIGSTTTRSKNAYTQCMDAYKTRALASAIWWATRAARCFPVRRSESNTADGKQPAPSGAGFVLA